MDKSKGKDVDRESSTPMNNDFLTELTQATERIIVEAGKKAGREAEQEMERILGEYERKTKQIILKIKEETKAKTAEIATTLSEAIMLRIEQASARAVTSAASEFSNRAGELTMKLQETAEKETSQEISKVSGALLSDTGSNDGNVPQEESIKSEAKQEDTAQEVKSVAEEGEIELQQTVETEDFDRWLTQ
ncbi:MAG: hypothetical protein JSV32_05660 [Dehalococcoidia bacterium]|nr:MAG: hypothetical protein JSV32_05660 [Dehalococcoidia bacterium]